MVLHGLGDVEIAEAAIAEHLARLDAPGPPKLTSMCTALQLDLDALCDPSGARSRAVATAAASQRHGIPSCLRPPPSAYVTPRSHIARFKSFTTAFLAVVQTRDFWKRQDRPRSGGGGGGGGGGLCSKLQIFDRDSRQTLYSLGV